MVKLCVLELVQFQTFTIELIIQKQKKNKNKQELIRFKDFIINSSNNFIENKIVLQDGGELCDNILSDMPDEVWNNFQKNFLDEIN